MKDIWGIRINKEVPATVNSVSPVSTEPKTLEIVENRIYFYSEIDRMAVLTLNKTLRQAVNDNRILQVNREAKDSYSMFLHIMSFGGSVFAGLAAMDQLLQVRKSIPIVTIIDGCCASSATFLSVVGTKRIINANSFMLIHQLSSVFWGKYEECKDEMQNLNLLMKKIKEIYGKYTKIPGKELEVILKKDLWIEPKKCLKWGLVDEISN